MLYATSSRLSETINRLNKRDISRDMSAASSSNCPSPCSPAPCVLRRDSERQRETEDSSTDASTTRCTFNASTTPSTFNPPPDPTPCTYSRPCVSRSLPGCALATPAVTASRCPVWWLHARLVPATEPCAPVCTWCCTEARSSCCLGMLCRSHSEPIWVSRSRRTCESRTSKSWWSRASGLPAPWPKGSAAGAPQLGGRLEEAKRVASVAAVASVAGATERRGGGAHLAARAPDPVPRPRPRPPLPPCFFGGRWCLAGRAAEGRWVGRRRSSAWMSGGSACKSCGAICDMLSIPIECHPLLAPAPSPPTLGGGVRCGLAPSTPTTPPAPPSPSTPPSAFTPHTPVSCSTTASRGCNSIAACSACKCMAPCPSASWPSVSQAA
mmetsp:Transcript_35198/g.56854  ORF Transcript_35198/g.56854 Transcript_35198/m.56854 type:complete len:382 (-) Transcript_35198:212-1357(-)